MIAFTDKPLFNNPTGYVETGVIIAIPLSSQVAIEWPVGSSTVLSVQPNGSYDTRDKSQIGQYESFSIQGSNLIVNSPAGPVNNVYSIPFVNL